MMQRDDETTETRESERDFFERTTSTTLCAREKPTVVQRKRRSFKEAEEYKRVEETQKNWTTETTRVRRPTKRRTNEDGVDDDEEKRRRRRKERKRRPTIRSERRTSRSSSSSAKTSLDNFVERDSLKRFAARYCALLPNPRSTIANAYSCDGTYVASTHGDHTVKIIDVSSGECVKVLCGHRRTPWVVRFHPSNPNVLASGSLDNTVRVWDISENDESFGRTRKWEWEVHCGEGF